jgi:hypothetical protein
VTDHDARELERFQTFLRLLDEAVRAGVPRDEAWDAIYPDVFGEEEVGEVA